MKICAKHLSELSHAIKRKGMGRYSPPSDPEISKIFAQRWLSGEVRSGEFIAIVVAVLEVHKKFQDLVGYRIRNFPDDACPLCKIDALLQQNAAEQWVDNVTDALVMFCEVNGLPRG